MASIANNTELVLINASNPGTINLPSASLGRVLTFKDVLGTFGTNSLTLVCGNSDTFEDGSTSKILKEKNGILQIVGSGTKWYILNGTQQNSITVSTIQCLSISTNSISSATTTVSTLNFENPIYNISTLMYFNSNVFAGSRVWPKILMKPKTITTFYLANYPNTIPRLSFWLDAADASTIILNGASSISQWNDKSPLGINVTQATLAKMPQYIFNSVNNYNIVRFNLANATALTNTVKSLNLNNGPATFILLERNMTGTNAAPFSFTSGPNGGIVFQSNGGLQPIFSVPFTSATPRIDIYYRANTGGAGTAETSYVNGTYILPNDNSTGTYSVGINVGYRTGLLYMSGDILELIIYPFQLSNNQRQRIEGYLAWKWAIQASLPSTHPFRYFPPG